MGTDITTAVEVRRCGTWVHIGDSVRPFSNRSYGVFGFLANVRNYSRVPTVVELAGVPGDRGLPVDASGEVRAEFGYGGGYGVSWLTVAELDAVDYGVVFRDRRVSRVAVETIGGRQTTFTDGAVTTDDPAEGRHLTLAEFLGESFFEDLSRLRALGPPGDVRVVFWFDC